jgi:hypothetical protein
MKNKIPQIKLATALSLVRTCSGKLMPGETPAAAGVPKSAPQN